MYQPTFGNAQQIRFASEEEYYELLGYLAKGNRSTKFVHEKNDEQGAYSHEYRIHFYENQPNQLRAQLSHTEGRGRIITRVNCNEFGENLLENHNFTLGYEQNIPEILNTIPEEYRDDFNNGLAL